MTPELVNFLQEALQIAEADEAVWAVKLMSPKVLTSLNRLRTACIEILCTTMAWADFRTQSHNELRAKIISMFFKSLTCQALEIVTVAKEGLRQVPSYLSFISNSCMRIQSEGFGDSHGGIDFPVPNSAFLSGIINAILCTFLLFSETLCYALGYQSTTDA